MGWHGKSEVVDEEGMGGGKLQPLCATQGLCFHTHSWYFTERWTFKIEDGGGGVFLGKQSRALGLEGGEAALENFLGSSSCQETEVVGRHGAHGRKWAAAFLWRPQQSSAHVLVAIFRMVALLLSQTEILTCCWTCQYLIGSLIL